MVLRIDYLISFTVMRTLLEKYVLSVFKVLCYIDNFRDKFKLLTSTYLVLINFVHLLADLCGFHNYTYCGKLQFGFYIFLALLLLSFIFSF